MKIFNLPNSLTVARIILVPVFVTAVIYQRHREALVLFGLAAVTDLLDGFIARLADQKTALGRFLDPLADKLLLTSSFILFSFYGWIPLWLTITVISRDLIVVVGWLLLYLVSHDVRIEPVLSGKSAIALQLITVAFVLLGINMSNLGLPMEVFFVATAVMTAVSGMQYVYRGLRSADVR